MMLSRMADSLYWVGRYLERAEDASRFLEVHLQQLVEDPTIDEHQGVLSLLAVMGHDVEAVTAGRTPDVALLLDVLCYDAASPGSLRFTVRAAREAARRVREALSAELWEAINAAYHLVNSPNFARHRPQAVFQSVRQRCVLALGLAHQTLSRDVGWVFLELGRGLERVDMTARLISAAAVSSGSIVAWGNALRACGAYHAFLRTYSGRGSMHDAAAFLMLDRQFPHSLVHALRSVESLLAQLDPVAASSQPHPAMLLIGRSKAALEYIDPELFTHNLPERMEELQNACAEVGALVTKRYFEVSTNVVWRQVPACV